MTDTILDADACMRETTAQLRHRLGERLLFTGLQGSYRRGEADEQSDLDIVVIVDTVDLFVLKQYKEILDALPWKDRACGFVGGREDMRCWPAQELFQFRYDTVGYYGELDPLLPPLRREDVILGVHVGVSGVYHAICHTYLHGGDTAPAVFAGACKGLFFPLIAKHWLETGEYIGSRSELAKHLTGSDAAVLAVSNNFRAAPPAELADEDVEMVMEWCQNVLRAVC